MYEWRAIEGRPRADRTQRSRDERHWGRFRPPVLVRETAAITHLSFHPDAPHDVSVCCGPRVRVYDGFTGVDVRHTFAKFKGVAYGARYRSDGHLLVCGGEEGRVRVFDASSRSMLKQFKGHVGAVRATQFAPNKTTILSGGDDGTLRGWDLPTGTLLWNAGAIHSDQIRSSCIPLATPDVWITGGYDCAVRAWDTRTSAVQYALATTHPVEAVLSVEPYQLAVAHGNAVSLFDQRFLDAPLVVLANHAKTVTCLDTSENGTKLLTGSADHTVKLWNISTDHQCVLTKRYAQPILAMGIAPKDENFFVVGMADGTLSMELRPPHRTATDDPRDVPAASSGRKRQFVSTDNPRHFYRGADSLPAPDDVRVASERPRARKSELDNLLRKFRYADALDVAVAGSDPSVAVALFCDYVDRNCLDGALAGRTDEGVLPIFRFVYDYIGVAHFDGVLGDVLTRLLKLYSATLHQSDTLMELVEKTRARIQRQIELQMRYVELRGQVESVTLRTKIEQ